MGNSLAAENRKRGRTRGMGNSLAAAPAPLGKTHNRCLEWKIHDFSALLGRGDTSTNSDMFHCSGYQWYLVVNPMHKKHGSKTPYVALRLAIFPSCLDSGRTINAVFQLSVYNHSNGQYYGCKASHDFHLSKSVSFSEMQWLIPLQKLLKSSDFLVDDTCVFGVEISKLDVCSPEKKDIVVGNKATSVQNLFIQKKGFIKGTYTWTINNFPELEMNDIVRSPAFEVGGCKWCIRMYPHDEVSNTGCLSLYLEMYVSDELPPESGKFVEMTLSIMNQKDGKHLTAAPARVVFSRQRCWGWRNFGQLETLKDPSRGYIVGSCCIVKADFTIIGSANEG